MSSDTTVENLIINTIRTLSIDAIQKANSGHPGAPMGLAPAAYTLWDNYLKFDPSDPHWPNRDRFVLSVGHASMLLYSVLHINGYDITLDDIKNFRQLNSKCAGHPEYGQAPGVETTTGPLGQGAATSVGMAMAERWLESYFNRDSKLIDYNVFSMLGDGCMMEGIVSEAASLAGHLGLSNLIWIYDSNNITIEGNTDIAFTEDVSARFRAYGWRVELVEDANDTKTLAKSIEFGVKETNLPTLIVVKSLIAFGSPNKQDKSDAHGSPLGEDEVAVTKKGYGWDPAKTFHVPEEIDRYRDHAIKRGRKLRKEWQAVYGEFAAANPQLAREFEMIQAGEIPTGWNKNLPTFTPDSKGIATRSANGKILNAVASGVPWFIGGSADLGPSNTTVLAQAGDFQKGSYDGRNLHFGVREHAMGAIANGLNLSGLRSYVATFMVFNDYLRPAIRLAALMSQPVIYVFTHDSIGVGEDGPTHQPVEQLAALRAIPNLDLFRPADATELITLWNHIMTSEDRPVALALTRQAVPVIDRTIYKSADGALKGAYVLADCDGTPEVILIGTGSEVHLCLDAYNELTADGVKARVVSMPSWELFERQDAAYKEEVLPQAIKARVAVEAGVSMGWDKYVGCSESGRVIGLDSFGESAPASELFPKFGFTVEAVVEAAKQVIGA